MRKTLVMREVFSPRVSYVLYAYLPEDTENLTGPSVATCRRFLTGFHRKHKWSGRSLFVSSDFLLGFSPLAEATYHWTSRVSPYIIFNDLRI